MTTTLISEIGVTAGCGIINNGHTLSIKFNGSSRADGNPRTPVSRAPDLLFRGGEFDSRADRVVKMKLRGFM